MHIEIDLERLLKEKHKSKNFVCEECGLQRTQFNNYCKNKVSRVDLTILAKMCACLDCTPNDILKIGSLSIVGVGFVKIPPQFYEKGPFYV